MTEVPAVIGGTYEYRPGGSPQHPAYGLRCMVTGILYEPTTKAVSIRVLGPDGQYDPTLDTFLRDYTGPIGS